MGKKTLVLGASFSLNRYSNLVIKRLLDANYQVFAIGDKAGDIYGISIKTSKIPFLNIDTVTIYLNSKNQRSYYDYIISLDPKRVIFNPGAENPEFYEILKEHDINYEVACTLVLLSTNQY